MTDVTVLETAEPLEFLSTLRRRLALVLGVGAFVFVAAIVAALVWPPAYTSQGTILIEAPNIPDDLVRSTVSTYADQRLQTIQQRVMTTQNLLAIIEKFNLYAEDRKRTPATLIVDRMRERIALELVSADVTDPASGRTRRATIAFTVSFDGETPNQAQLVANELVTLYLAENQRSRQEQAAGTATFLSEEQQRLQTQVRDIETKLAVFKARNAGSLPEQLSVNTQLLDRTQSQLLEVMRQVQSLRERRSFLQSQLAQTSATNGLSAEGEALLSPEDQLRTLELRYVSLSAKFGQNHPEVAAVRRQIEALSGKAPSGRATVPELNAKLADLNAQLTDARKKFGDSHPDVTRLEREIAATGKALTTASRAPQSLAATPQLSAPANNPAYIQLQTQLGSANAELAALEVQEKALHEKVADLEARVLKTPEVEREYADLQRQYDTLNIKFRELSEKQGSASLAQSLEADRLGERFSVIEPPTAPIGPSRPNRPAIVLLGAFLGVFAGIGGAMAADFLSGRVYGQRQVSALLGYGPLAVIPYVRTLEERQRDRRRWQILAIVIVTLLFGAIIFVHVMIRPLDIVVFALLNRLGL
ncbi:MAG: lipopolysaccharide biosynthesis protein [Alphaproteobacteria bacterium]|nr:lipopolysaccharide biosynthesis protein [Alphaproteobacteria bacterium]